MTHIIGKKTSLVKVICEACMQYQDTECILCHGQRFYLWDPNTLLCYAFDGSQIVAAAEDGGKLPVTRQLNTLASGADDALDMQTMIEFIELWVSETPVRKWKLTFDENGWHGCVWFNRYKKTCFETHDAHLINCIKLSYKEIIKKSPKKAR
jgi:hypothetical protein